MSFRADINGLRALAVIAVLFYHFGVTGFGGGYVGVDVFYVISGFLMTQIICTKLAGGKFSLGGFYAARARRILPALGALVTFLLIGGLFYLPPVDYKLFGWQSLSALTFFSNILFSHSGDYFDTSSQEKWLLHTWSLSVEWQFYILLPLCLMGLQKLGGKKFLKRGIIATFIVSLLLSLVVTRFQPTAAFFLLPTRAWEMLAGGLVFFYGQHLAKIPYLTEAGLACILAAVFFYSGDLNFPGAWAVLPVAGTAFIIAAQSKNVLLDNRFAQFFGTISYSLYLWHWPVMVGAKYFDVPFKPLYVVLLLAAVTLLAKVSYILVEELFRHNKKSGVYSIISYALIALFAWLIYAFDGIPSRVAADVLAATQTTDEIKLPKRGRCVDEYKNSTIPPDCIIGADTTPTAVIWGDSHASALSSSLGQSLMEVGRSGFLYSYSGCPPILGAVMATKWKKDQCKLINQATYDKTVADSHIRDVFLISRWSLYLLGYNEKGGASPYVVFDNNTAPDKNNIGERSKQYTQKMAETMCALTAHGKNVYVMAPVPEMGRNVSAALAKSRLIWHRDDTVDLPLQDYMDRNAIVRTALAKAVKECHVHVLDPEPLLCNTTVCSGIRNGMPLYADDNHLNVFGNRLVKPLFTKVLQAQPPYSPTPSEQP